MKKLLFFFALATLAACNTEEGSKDQMPESANFGGTLTVTSNKTPDTQPYIASKVHFELTNLENDITLTMHEIRFTATMPMSFTIVIPKLKADNKSNFISTVDPIVPYIGGKPYDQFQILGFSCSYSEGKLRVSFTCVNPKIPVGGETLNHKAEYVGNILL